MTEVERWRRVGSIPDKVLVLVAHPDDEALGAGSQLGHLRGARFVHVTDGAPRDLRDARAAGCAGRQKYAALRRTELYAALALGGIRPEQTHSLDIVDQEASLRMADVACRLSELYRKGRPAFVLTHPYEGGHPDHDATSFAAWAACRLLERGGETPPDLIEMASYHGAPGYLTVGEFLPMGGPGVTLALTEAERAAKRRLLECYRSQRDTLRHFPAETERFRLAPRYDFARPPHSGTLWYERFDWGMTGPRWRALAVEASAELGIGETPWG